MSQIHKPAKAEDRETDLKVEEEVSSKGPPSTLESSIPRTIAGGTSFFRALPRELRDAVYDYTFEHFVKQQSDTDDDVTFHFHAPVSNLRLVSRQFTAEYDEHYRTFPPRNTLLSIVNNSRGNRQIWYGVCPQLATRCRELKTIRTFFDGGDEYTGTAHHDVLQKFLTHFHNTVVLVKSMPNFRRVDMRFDFESLHHAGYPDKLLYLFHRFSILSTWPAEGRYKIRYQGLTYPQPDKLLELRVPNIDILDAPIVPGTWNQALQMEQVDRRELEQHLRVEAAVLDAWKAKHGCTLWKAKGCLGKRSRATSSRRRPLLACLVLRGAVCKLRTDGM